MVERKFGRASKNDKTLSPQLPTLYGEQNFWNFQNLDSLCLRDGSTLFKKMNNIFWIVQVLDLCKMYRLVLLSVLVVTENCSEAVNLF